MYRKVIKRILDIVFSFVLLMIFLISLLIVVPLIFGEDRGPVFYRSKRLGLNGKEFDMLKYRTMKLNSPDIRNNDGTTFNAVSDIRITKIGKILRKTSIDELPQIVNVIKGDMSLIGPRPDLLDALYLYGELEKKKLMVKPGITGYNQAFYRNSATLETRFKNDFYYVENLSFILDLKIIIQTIKTVLKQENINSSR